MRPNRRLDRIEAALREQHARGPACDQCGAPSTVWRPMVWLGIESSLGTCDGCGRRTLKATGRPVEPEHWRFIVRGEPPPGWKPLA